MKKIIFIVFMALLAGAKISAQVKVVGNLTTNGAADTYPTHLDKLGFGGYRVVADIAERDAISTQRRTFGMLVYVQADNNLYVLRDVALGNADWRNLSTQLTPTSLGLLANLSVSGVIEGGTFSGTLSQTAMNTITALGNLSNITLTGNVTASAISSLNGTFSNLYVPGTITGGTFSGTLSATALNTVTSLGNLSALTVNGSVYANNLTVIGTVTGNSISSVNGTINNLYVPGTITGGTFSGTLSATAQNTITSLGNLQNLTVVNSISAANITVSGTVTAATLSGVLASGPQPGITQVGTLNTLTVTNSINAANITVSGIVTAATLSGVLAPGPQTGITQVGNLTALTVTNSINAANITVSGTVTAATLSGVLASGPQTGITQVGNLTALTVTNSINASNITVSGTITAATMSTSTVQANRYLASITVLTSATNLTVDLSQGNMYALTLTGSSTFAFSNAPANPASYVFKIIFSSASAFTITWPGTIKWSGGTAPTLTCATAKTDMISLIWDGTNYYGTYAQNF